mgnify:CR=1 FL=1|tara:strand:- start:27725 stop:29083 length:1359 start_codon:yes stop_codon:yes gene_type:complete
MSKAEKRITDDLFSAFKKLDKIYEERENEYRYHVNVYGDSDSFEIDLVYDLKLKPLQEEVLNEIDKVYQNANNQNIYFFDCSFKVYKKLLKNRKENYFKNNLDANDLDFISSEVEYFSKPSENRVFEEKVQFYYHTYFETKECFAITLRRKLEYLNESLNIYDLQVDLSDFNWANIKFNNIKIIKKDNKQNLEPNNPMITNSSWDYPLNNEYQWCEMILDSFKTVTDRKNPEAYFNSQLNIRKEIHPKNRFFPLCKEYAIKLKETFKELAKNNNEIPKNPSLRAKQIINCKHIIDPAYDPFKSLFSEKPENNSGLKFIINEDDFDNIISSIDKLINEVNISDKEGVKNKEKPTFKNIITAEEKKVYILKLLEDLSITVDGQSILTSRKKGALRGVVEALRESRIIPNIGLATLCTIVASEIHLELKSELDASTTSEHYKKDTLVYIKNNPLH